MLYVKVLCENIDARHRWNIMIVRFVVKCECLWENLDFQSSIFYTDYSKIWHVLETVLYCYASFSLANICYISSRLEDSFVEKVVV